MRLALATGALCLVASTHAARADVHGWEVAATAGTNAPLDLELGAEAESPQRIRVAMTVGIMPQLYARGIDHLLVGVGAFDQATGDLVGDSLSTSAVWRTMVGYRPFRHSGFYAMAGYALVVFGGSTTADAALEAATHEPPPASDAGKSFEIDSHLHTLDAELGWRWRLDHNLLLQVALGGVFTIGAGTAITPNYAPKDPAATAAYTREADAYLDHIYTSYVFSPTVIVTAGYRL
jgi:hypothetical protein|nr:hypothetical protein [Kofleriaceae bacterium]